MADKATKFLYQTAADLTGAKQFVQAQEKIKVALESVGRTLDKNAKFVGQTSTVYGQGAKAVLTLNQAYQNSNGTFDIVTAKFKAVNGALKQIPGSVSVATKNFNTLGQATHGISGNLEKLASRALLTIPIWFALRAALSLTLNTFRDGVKFMIDFESILAQVQIVGNSTKEEVNKLGVEALKLGTKFGISFDEVGDALISFAQQGFKANEIIKVLGPTLEFAQVSGRKVGDVVQDLVAIQTSFNLSAEDTTRIYDSISAAQLKYSITTGQLAAGLRKLSPVTAALGISLQETEGLLVAVQQQTRQSGEAVATALESIIGRLESVDTVGKLQAFTKIPLFMDEAGKATADFTGRVRPAQEILAVLSDRFKTATDAEKAYIAVVLGGRTRFAEAAALLDQYKLSLDATLTSIFSYNATQTASNILLDTTKVKLQQLTNQWKELVDVMRNPVFKPAVDFGINAFKTALGPRGAFGPLGLGIEDFERDSKRKEELDKKAIKAEEDKAKIVGIVSDAYRHLLELQDEFAAREQAAAGNPALLNVIKAQKQNTAKRFAEEINALSKQSGGSLPSIKGGSFEDVSSQLLPIASKDKDLRKEIAYRAELRRETETTLELEKRLKDLEVKRTQEGKSKVFIIREQIKLLNEQLKVQNGLFSKSEQDRLKRLKIQLSEFENKKKIELEDIKNANNLKVAVALGENDIQIQVRRVELARERMEATGDETEYLKEQLELQGLINDKIAQSANELKSATQSALSSLIQGEGDINSFFDTIGKTIKTKIADSLASGLTDKFFQFSGIGGAFGGLTTGLQLAFTNGSLVTSNAIISASQIGASYYASAISGRGIPGVNMTSSNPALNPTTGKTTSASSSGGLIGSLFGLFKNKGGAGANATNTGTSSGSFFGGSNAMAGLGSAAAALFAYQSAKQQSQQGDRVGAAFSMGLAGFALGGPIGAAVGASLGFSNAGAKRENQGLRNGFGLFQHHKGFFKNFYDPIGLFKKPKKITTVEEETKDFQVASRIDVTNKKLDVVNRNLVALKQSFDTFILPDSAYFGTKRNIEDQFSVNSRRGLV